MRFIDGLNYGLRYGMAQEYEMDTITDLVVEIARCLEHVCRLEREERDAKRSHSSDGFGGASYGGQSYYSRGHPFRSAQIARQIPRGLSVSYSSYNARLV